MRKFLFALKYITLAGIFYALLLVCVYQTQESLLFWPFRLHASHEFCFDAHFEEHFIGENGELHGLYFPSVKPTKGVVLYLHGNSKNLQYWGRYVPDFLERGYEVFAIDYRGYGKSKGMANQDRMYQDACEAYEWLRECIQPDEIILYGRSLGAAVAAHLAQDNPAKMLIMETPFYSMRHVVKDKAPVLLLPLPLKNEFPNYKYLPEISMPVHLVHGTMDELVNYEQSLQLAELLKPGDSFTTIPEARHRNLNQFEQYHELLDRLPSVLNL